MSNYSPFDDMHIIIYSRTLSVCRPGAGKSTVSQAAVRLLGGGDGSKVCTGKLSNVDEFLYIYLDLDVCVPQWMKVSCLHRNIMSRRYNMFFVQTWRRKVDRVSSSSSASWR